MKRIIVFGASNSRNSINKKLATYVGNQLNNFDIVVLDLNDFEMPIYSIDREKTSGIPPLAHKFKEKINYSHGIIISFAEHNGAYTAAYKNIYDWVSRIEKDFWRNTPLLLLSTSPGARGAKGVLELALSRYRRSNENLIGGFSLPSFSENFNKHDGITNSELNDELSDYIASFEERVHQFEIDGN